MDVGRLQGILARNEITPPLFCGLHNFYARYIITNMLVPGQVEKYVTLTNVNQFPIKELPVSLFKECAKEITVNYIDYASK